MQKVNLDIVPRAAGGVPVRADQTEEDIKANRPGRPLTLRHFISEALCVDPPGKEQAKIADKRRRYRLAEKVEDHPESEFEFDASQIVEINEQLAAGFWTRISGQCAELIEGGIQPKYFLSDFDPETWELLERKPAEARAQAAAGGAHE